MPPLSDVIAGLMTALEQSGLGTAARGSAWLYPLANLTHVLGAAFLVGAVATFDIQVLRRAPGAGAVLRAVTPVATLGLVLQIASGIVLLSADALPVARNPAFQFKMAVLLLGLLNVAIFRWRFRPALRADANLDHATGLAVVSLTSWTLVLLAGRFIAYL
jgi:hypothetical protein